ncbi:VOC family protein [Caulobacter segnis]|jgi:predicted enzyme related to lactoylglutathione lyase|uniref:VOC family protein n=1 Tax=Caulobacter segnis TaxID=88688 RepID=UPI001CBA8E0C|nr:VOC family protein [Caulobacter segnis]UAL12161.1 VOC family protein [Caulobacter segnis]
MPATFRHFAINADDTARARRFYEGVFGWRFDPWGPPDFYQVKNAGQGLLGALQGRRELVPGVRMAGYEASFGVEDLKATIAAIEAGGGKIVMPPYRIEGVGELIYFEDTEGNLVGAMQYDPGVFD